MRLDVRNAISANKQKYSFESQRTKMNSFELRNENNFRFFFLSIFRFISHWFRHRVISYQISTRKSNIFIQCITTFSILVTYFLNFYFIWFFVDARKNPCKKHKNNAQAKAAHVLKSSSSCTWTFYISFLCFSASKILFCYFMLPFIVCVCLCDSEKVCFVNIPSFNGLIRCQSENAYSKKCKTLLSET